MGRTRRQQGEHCLPITLPGARRELVTTTRDQILPHPQEFYKIWLVYYLQLYYMYESF